ncbi:Abhydrolase domain-containing protein mpaH [Paramyrothecium foliicola]|nr:Abhydrolase domain-containing protein mpaH [Paramyrothecium foliicola]
MSTVFNVHEHVIEASHIREYARATSNTQEEVLKLHVKQYVPKDNADPADGDVTIIGAQANGFPKELYEPLWDDLYQELKKQGVRIRAVWIADAAWQGYSGVLNEGKLGNDPSWLDHPRDILHMINTFRMPRPLIGVGHSFGGNAIANVALIHPRLFTSIVLLDPIISPWASTSNPDSNNSLAALSMYRRDTWPSRKVAAESFLKSPFYQSWDSRVFKRWVEHGLRDVPVKQGEVTLTTTRHQEVYTYLRPSYQAYDSTGKTLLHPDLVPDLDPSLSSRFPTYPFYRPEPPNTSARLGNLRPSVLYIFGDKSDASPKDLQEQKLQVTGVGVGGSGGAKRGRVKAASHPDLGHLVPMESPSFCARHAAEWAKSELDRWRAEEQEYREWIKLPPDEKVEFTEDYRKYTGQPSRRKKDANAKI